MFHAPVSDSLVLIVILVVLYKLQGRYFDRRAGRKQRQAAERQMAELDRAIREQRRAVAMKPPPPPPPTPAKNPASQWDHIPRIAFDLDTQLEFGGSRYHTVYVSPEEAADFDIKPGVYVTDLREGPEKIGENRRKRTFIPHDQLIIR